MADAAMASELRALAESLNARARQREMPPAKE
jgi:hypothetical protein